MDLTIYGVVLINGDYGKWEIIHNFVYKGTLTCTLYKRNSGVLGCYPIITLFDDLVF